MYYKTKLQNSLFYVLTVLFLTSLLFNCSDNETVDQTSSNKAELDLQKTRIDFTDYKEFNQKIDDLSSLTNEELGEWTLENNPNSLYNHLKDNPSLNNNYLESLPNAYKAIFNSDSEVVISGKIIWLNNEKLYEFNVSDDIRLLKSKVDELKQVGSIKVNASDVKGVSDNNSLSSRDSVGQNVNDSRYQHEFRRIPYYECDGTFIPANNTRLKYVHELTTVQTVFHQTAAYSKLYLRVKLEWKGRRRWKPASRPRDMKINIDISGTYLTFHNGVIIAASGSNSINLNYTCSLDQTILLKSSDSYGIEGGSPYWSVQSTGTISHRLHNASDSSAWNHYFIF